MLYHRCPQTIFKHTSTPSFLKFCQLLLLYHFPLLLPTNQFLYFYGDCGHPEFTRTEPFQLQAKATSDKEVKEFIAEASYLITTKLWLTYLYLYLSVYCVYEVCSDYCFWTICCHAPKVSVTLFYSQVEVEHTHLPVFQFVPIIHCPSDKFFLLFFHSLFSFFCFLFTILIYILARHTKPPSQVFVCPLVFILVFLTLSLHQFSFFSIAFTSHFLLSQPSFSLWPYCFSVYQSPTSLFFLSFFLSFFQLVWFLILVRLHVVD